MTITLEGGPAKDVLDAEEDERAGPFVVIGGGENDQLSGTKRTDGSIDGVAGNGRLFGGGDDSTASWAARATTPCEANACDTLYGGADDDLIYFTNGGEDGDGPCAAIWPAAAPVSTRSNVFPPG